MRLTTTSPSLGKTLQVAVDLGRTAHPLAFVFSFTDPASIVLTEGQTLLTLGPALFSLPLVGYPSATGNIVIPNDPQLSGMQFSLQAAHIGGGQTFALSNARDLVLGR